MDSVPSWYGRIMQVAIKGVKRKISLLHFATQSLLMMPRKVNRIAEKAGKMAEMSHLRYSLEK
jgi:hypothetical protein